VKKIIILSVLISLISLPAFAEKLSEVSLRSGGHENNLRIVLESDENLIRNASTIYSLSSVTVEFPMRFELKGQKEFIFSVVKRERSLVINLKDVAAIRTYKLTSPARIVIDLTMTPKKQAETAPKPEPKVAPFQNTEHKDENTAKQTAPKPAATPQALQKSPVDAVKQNGFKPQNGQPAEKPRKKVMVVDPGHGGYDYGLLSQDSKEKDVDLVLAKDLGNALSKKGMTVFVTRKADQNASLTERINFSNVKNPDFFISLHSSASDNFVIYTAAVEEANVDTAVTQYSQFSSQKRHIEKSRGMARSIGEALQSDFSVSVLLRELPLPVLTSMNSAAILIECPLLKSYESDQKLREKFVNSVIKGMSAYEQ